MNKILLMAAAVLLMVSSKAFTDVTLLVHNNSKQSVTATIGDKSAEIMAGKENYFCLPAMSEGYKLIVQPKHLNKTTLNLDVPTRDSQVTLKAIITSPAPGSKPGSPLVITQE